MTNEAPVRKAIERSTGKKVELMPAADWLSYNGWKAVGRHVKMGEKAKHFDEFGDTALFHRSQTKEIAGWKPKEDEGDSMDNDDIPF